MRARVAFTAARARLVVGVCCAVGTSLATAVSAQAPPTPPTAAIGGTIVDARTGLPVIAAQVAVEGLGAGTTTDAGGRFRISVPFRASGADSAVRLTTRRLGYQSRSVMTTVRAVDLRIALTALAIDLAQVVESGAAGGAERRAIGSAVSVLHASDVVATQPVQSVADLLRGRVPGVSVTDGGAIRLRAPSGRGRTRDPLLYVDGVRVDHIPFAPAARLDDFVTDEIERITVIRGPAATTRYGTDAANGVVEVITKQGMVGAPRFSGTARVLDHPLTTAPLQELQLSARGGTGAVRYYAGGGHRTTFGHDRATQLSRTNLRANLQLRPTPAWDAGTTFGVISARADAPADASREHRALSTDRVTGTVQLANRPFSFLSHRLLLGLDRASVLDREHVPATTPVGSRRTVTNTTADYFANLTFSVLPSLRSITSVGVVMVSARRGPGDAERERKTVGQFVQQQFVFNDRLFVSTALRTDDTRADGIDLGAVTYPSISASYVLTDEPSLPIPMFVNQLRVRSSFGTGGVVLPARGVPGFMAPMPIDSSPLRLERHREFEAGIDAAMWQERFGMELTFFTGAAHDAVLPSRGRRDGVEWLMRVTPLRTDAAALDVSWVGSRASGSGALGSGPLGSGPQDDGAVNVGLNVMRHVRVVALVHASGAGREWDGMAPWSDLRGTRLRELSATVALSTRLASRLGANRAALSVAARNFGAAVGPARSGVPTARRQAFASVQISF